MRVPDFTLKCVGFVGEVASRDSSGVSGDLCATGFFASIEMSEYDPRFKSVRAVYFVTARHVADDLKGREFYFLVNKRGGGTLVIDSILGDQWWLHPNDQAADVAVAQVSNRPEADIISVDFNQFGTSERLQRQDIGIGDETYATGLFTPAPGTAQNVPIVRHGNIAMMAGEEIQTELGFASVHLVETRSIGGLSGSPVFVRPTIRAKVDPKLGKGAAFCGVGDGATLLGLMHGHWDIKESEMNRAFFTHDRKHGVNMGIGIVVPATKILETLNQEKLMEIRKEGLRQLQKSARGMIPGTDSAKPKSEDGEQFTREDFEGALKKATRKVPKK